MKLAFLSPFTTSVLKKYIPALYYNNVPRGMGGSAVFELVKGLIETGIEIHILTLQPGLEKIIEFHNNKVHYYLIPRRKKGSLRDLWRKERKLIIDTLRKINADVVHANWTYEYALAAINYDRNKALITAHDIPYKILKYTLSPYYLPLFFVSYYIYKKVKWITFVSDSVKNYAEKYLNRDCKYWIIPNIINLSDYKDYIKNKEKNGTPEKYFISVGLWNRLKNLKTSIKAFSLFVEKNPEYYYILIGPGLEKNSKAEKWILRNKYEKNVILLGKLSREETLFYLSKATALIHPSFTEAHPMAVGEAMALGVPVIVGENSDGATELVKKGEFGFITNIKRKQNILKTMEYIITNKKTDNNKNISKNFINDNYLVDKIIYEYMNIYLNINKI